MGTGRGNNANNPPPLATPAPPVQASPSQTYLDTRNTNLLKGLDSGKDVSQIKELSPFLDLYNSSKNDNQDYAGEGLLSPNALSGGNSGMLGLVGKQMRDRRQRDASGDLYNSVMGAENSATAGLQWGAGMDQSRNMGNADLANSRYTAWLQRPQRQPFWQQLLLGGQQAAGQIGAAAVGA